MSIHNCEKSAPFGFLVSGYRQDGERWTCPDCGKVWVHLCDEAEGCSWHPAKHQPRSTPISDNTPSSSPHSAALHREEGPELLAVIRRESTGKTLVVVAHERQGVESKSDTRARDKFCAVLEADTNTSET